MCDQWLNTHRFVVGCLHGADPPDGNHQPIPEKELANKIGITQTSVSDYETGRLRLSDEMVVRLAINLDVSADIILGLKRNRKEAAPSNLRILKRLKKISSLPPQRRKALLKTIDMAIEATEKSG